MRPRPPSLRGASRLPSLRLGPCPGRDSLPSGGGVLRGLRGTHWHSGQVRRPSAARPRRQPVQTWWKQSSRHGRSYCAWHSGHTSGWPLAASRAPGPSRGAKIAPDICGDGSGRRRGVPRLGARSSQDPGLGLGAAGAGRTGRGASGLVPGPPASPAPQPLTRTGRLPLLSPLPLPPQEFPSRCPLGDPQATPLPCWAAPLLGRDAPVRQPQTARCLAGSSHGHGSSVLSPGGGEAGSPGPQKTAPGGGRRLGKTLPG